MLLRLVRVRYHVASRNRQYATPRSVDSAVDRTLPAVGVLLPEEPEDCYKDGGLDAGDGYAGADQPPRKTGFQVGEVRLRRQRIERGMLGRLPQGRSDRVGLLIRQPRLNQRTRDSMRVEHVIRLPQAV